MTKDKLDLKDKMTQMWVDNEFDFSKFVLTITEPTKLQGSSFSISQFDEAERVYIRNRLKALTLIGEIIPDETIRKETVNYFTEDLFNLSVLSRTKEAWLVKQILEFAKNGNSGSSSLPLDMKDDKSKESSFAKKTNEL